MFRPGTGVIWVGVGVFCVRTYPRKGCVMAELRTGVGGGILGEMRSHLGKMSEKWAKVL